jgi:uncharacterized membrane protein
VRVSCVGRPPQLLAKQERGQYIKKILTGVMKLAFPAVVFFTFARVGVENGV